MTKNVGSKVISRTTKKIPMKAVEAARAALRAATPSRYTSGHVIADLFDQIAKLRLQRIPWSEITRIVNEHADIRMRTIQQYYAREAMARRLAAVSGASDRISAMLNAGKTWTQVHQAFPDLATSATELRRLYTDSGSRRTKKVAS